MGDELTIGMMALVAGAGLALFVATFWFQPLERMRGWFAAAVLAGGLFIAGRWTGKQQQPSDAIEDEDTSEDTTPQPLPQPSTDEAELRDRRERENETFNPEKPAGDGDDVGGRNWLDL